MEVSVLNEMDFNKLLIRMTSYTKGSRLNRVSHQDLVHVKTVVPCKPFQTSVNTNSTHFLPPR